MRTFFDSMRPKRGSESFVAMSSAADTHVAIFAGGKSSRFGSPKIKAKINDDEFGLLIINTLKRAGFAHITLIGGDTDDSRRWGVDYLEDIYPEAGPLGALITALQSCRSEHLMTLPCDVPFIDEDSCQRLCNLSTGAQVRIARTDTPQWMCGTWRRSDRDTIEHEFNSGERAVHRVVAKMKFEFVDVSSEKLLNVNNPSQLK